MEGKASDSLIFRTPLESASLDFMIQQFRVRSEKELLFMTLILNSWRHREGWMLTGISLYPIMWLHEANSPPQ